LSKRNLSEVTDHLSLNCDNVKSMKIAYQLGLHFVSS